MYTSKQKIIIDCDPGHDDAIALLVAYYSDDLDLIGVSTCAGNQTINKTSKNADNLLRFFGSSIKVAKGETDPIKRKVKTCPEIHGESGLDGYDFPKYKEEYDSRPAYQFIIDTVLANKDIIVVTTGPMTNLALAISKCPQITKNIKEIVLMGGSTTEGNITPEAEFNILVDPEAADICFKAGVPMRMLGLNVTRKILVTDEVIKEAEKLGTRGSDLFVKLMKVFNENQRKFFGLEYGPLHDPTTIISMVNSKAFRFEPMHVEIDTTDTKFLGKTRCSASKPYNCNVAVSVNLDEYWAEVYKHLRRCN